MKSVLILALIFFCAFTSFAQSHDTRDSSNTVEKLLVYEASKKEPLIPFLLNLILGFGIGSLAQGDIIGGLLVLGFDAAGIGLLAYGISSVGGISEFKTKNDMELPVLAISLITLGGLTLAVTRVVEIILPFTHAANYNKRLKQTLGIAFGGFQPTFNVNMNEGVRPGFGISFTKTY
ncbi:hypothetical protein CR532_00165 [Candidatus Borreliella tachyglossi]|uniref:Outer membrane protein P13 n=1 Tax=Candidatus Borreliella tachyglossi TaxID=1964448 RepID=A0A2S1LVW6_9SPIR|nr:P13 family porin [Candidatus Borreliella tachyglossi]AWG42439.1 hypothetical protein CR532_00165 [Candidatus Borreliella tachyglossi]